jgi:nitrate/nitrite-specific signal transduction histidine kinase
MRPLRRVVAGMKAVSGGASVSRIKIHGHDDFAELARGYNGMADAIEQRDKLLAKAEQEKGVATVAATCCCQQARPRLTPSWSWRASWR